MQRLIEQEQVTVTEQANWQSFLRERGWKCKALQSQVKRLCILQTSINLLGEKPAVELRGGASVVVQQLPGSLSILLSQPSSHSKCA